MKEWIMQNFDAAAIIGIITALCSLVAGIISLVNILRRSRFEKVLTAAKLRKTYTVCPRCGKKTALDDLHFYLEDGQVDDDLNGVPDVQERTDKVK